MQKYLVNQKKSSTFARFFARLRMALCVRRWGKVCKYIIINNLIN